MWRVYNFQEINENMKVHEVHALLDSDCCWSRNDGEVAQGLFSVSMVPFDTYSNVLCHLDHVSFGSLRNGNDWRCVMEKIGFLFTVVWNSSHNSRVNLNGCLHGVHISLLHLLGPLLSRFSIHIYHILDV